MIKKTLTIVIYLILVSSSYSQTSNKVGVFIPQRAAAEAIKVVNPTYLAAYGLGQVMDKNIEAMSNHWRATREAIENTDNYVKRTTRKEKPFSFINYEPDRQKLMRKLRNIEYFATLIKKSYDQKKVESYIKMILSIQDQINNIFIQYSGEPFFVDRSKINNIIGVWKNTIHTHIGCKKFVKGICDTYHVDLNFSIDEKGNTKASWPNFSLQGKFEGNIFKFKMYHGSKIHGSGEFTFNSAMNSFSGNWEDNFGHRGTWTGSR